jgi:trehalose-6-phosphatase
MGVMSDLDATLQEVARVMDDQPADTQLEYKLDRLISELDEMVALASSNPGLFEHQMIAVGQMLSRAQLVASAILGRPYPNMRIVGRG